MQCFFENNCICAIKSTQKKPNGLSKIHPALWQFEYLALTAQSMYFWRILECVLLLSKIAEKPILTGFYANWVGQKSAKTLVFMRFFRLLSYYTIFLYATYNTCCFHIFTPFLYSKMCQKPSIYAGFRDLLICSNYISPKPILPIFSFVLAGHKGLEDLGRVVVFVLC